MIRTALEEDTTTAKRTLYLALELSRKTWKLGFSAGGKKVRTVSVDGGSVPAVLEAAKAAKSKLGLPAEARVLSCYEAGRDGFWIHRMLVAAGVENLVVDPSCIEVDRRARRAKTDRLDATKLVQQLLRHDERGDRLRAVRVPSAEDEDARRPIRELGRLKQERGAHSNRIRGLLTLHGLAGLKVGKGFGLLVDALRSADGELLPEKVREELKREAGRLDLVRAQILQVERARATALKAKPSKAMEMAAMLTSLLGVGANAATILACEFFAWRDFKNGKQVGACAGMTGTPYDSGDVRREQGISKAGNWRVRAVMVELAWFWLRYQPRSRLARWWEDRFGAATGRMKRVGIVALARKLLVALWRYATQGIVPDGALTRA
jgi:transposase